MKEQECMRLRFLTGQLLQTLHAKVLLHLAVKHLAKQVYVINIYNVSCF